MPEWNHIAEARIREWLDRPEHERAEAALSLDPHVPLEVQLMQDIAQLDRMIAATLASDPNVSWMQRRARELVLRLLVVLEREGKPLMALHYAEQRRPAQPRAT